MSNFLQAMSYATDIKEKAKQALGQADSLIMSLTYEEAKRLANAGWAFGHFYESETQRARKDETQRARKDGKEFVARELPDLVIKILKHEEGDLHVLGEPDPR